MENTALFVLLTIATATIFYAAFHRNFGLLTAAVIAGTAHVAVLFGSDLLGTLSDATPPAEGPQVVELVYPDVLKLETDPPPLVADPADEIVKIDYAPPGLPELPPTIRGGGITQPPRPPPPPGTPIGGDRMVIPRGTGAGGGLKGTIFEKIELDRQPEPTFRVEPNYPYDLKRQGIAGSVELAFIVDSRGAVHDVRVIRSSNPGFEQAAIAALRQWKFRPGRKNNTPVNTRNIHQEITFSLARS